jgi:hypothetical protein
LVETKTIVKFAAQLLFMKQLLLPDFYDARVAELVDALDSKSSSFGSAGSIPASGTLKPIIELFGDGLFF